MHTEIMANLKAALAHLDEYGLALPAIHLCSAIEALQAHIDATFPSECPPESEKD